MSIEVIGVGAINIDYLCQVKEVLADGESAIEHVKATPGGSAANTIYGLAKLGIPTGFIGAVGDDEEGKACLQDFQAMGVDTSQIQIKKGERTGYALCLSDELDRRSIYVSPQANSLLDLQDTNLSYLNQAKIVHLSSFVDDKQFNMQIELVEKLSRSVKISFAPGMLYADRGIGALSPLLKRTHIFFINKEEIERLTQKDFVAGAEQCVDLGCQIAVVTLGRGLEVESGKLFTSCIFDKSGEHKIESKAQPRSKLEATGSGDAFAAGFLFGFLKGKRVEECGRLGDKMAQFAMSRIGAREGLPSSVSLLCATEQPHESNDKDYGNDNDGN
jgi:ribokinase